MADLDAELLALAGGDDSSDEEVAPPTIAPMANMSAGAGNSIDRAGSEESGEIPRSKVSTKNGTHASRSMTHDVEDGELSSTSQQSRNTLQSASMSESESESSPAPDDDAGPLFPYDKLFYSAKDKEEVMAYPEIQREQILSERAQQVDRHNQDIALRRLLASREREEALAAEKKKKKRKVGSTDLGQGPRKSTRQKTGPGGRKVGEGSAIDAYKRRREQKGKRDEQRRRDTTARKSLVDGTTSDRDDQGESEVEWDESWRVSPTLKDELPTELRDFQRARVGRSNFAQVCFYPGFEQAISNCYCRLNVGINKETQQNEYRVCLIKGFKEGKPYAMEAPNGRSFVTEQYAILLHGKAERDFPFIACSDSPFTEAEFNRYRKTMVVEGCTMPTKSMINAKVTDINRLINHRFTKEELEEKLRRQGANDNKMKVFERIQLEKRRQEAIASRDEAAIAKCDAELARFIGPKLAFGTSLAKPKSTGQTQQDRIAELNIRNQKLNAENVRRAQLEERKAERLAAAAVARGEAVANRFARVKTRARTHYDMNGSRQPSTQLTAEDFSEISRPVTPITGANTPTKPSTPPKRSGTPLSLKTEGSQQRKGLPIIRHRPTADEELAALDFEIDIEI